MSDTQLKKAIWTPSWFEMDQSISVGVHDRFCFFQGIPTQAEQQDVDLVFYNQIDSHAENEIRMAEVAAIRHERLGQLKRVDTAGLDYIFVLVDDKEILVNAEEEPGKCYDEIIAIDDWTVVVTLANVSEPVGDIV